MKYKLYFIFNMIFLILTTFLVLTETKPIAKTASIKLETKTYLSTSSIPTLWENFEQHNEIQKSEDSDNHLINQNNFGNLNPKQLKRIVRSTKNSGNFLFNQNSDMHLNGTALSIWSKHPNSIWIPFLYFQDTIWIVSDT